MFVFTISNTPHMPGIKHRMQINGSSITRFLLMLCEPTHLANTIKRKAIMEYANTICHLIPAFKVGQASTPILKLGNRVGMLPVPPSKAQDDPHYDDRNFQTVTQICSQTGFRLCRDIETISPIVASHSGGTRNPQTIKQSLGRIARNANECDWVFLVDDVLVSGAHFVAVSELLRETEFTGEIIGLFLARSNS